MPNGKKNSNARHEHCVGCDNPRSHCHCAHLVLATALFGLGLLALLFAWIADSGAGTVLGFSADHLFHDSIAFMAAAIFFKRKF